MGGSSAFIGRVKNDALEIEYIKDMDDAGVKFTSNPSETGLDTGRCLVYVTPDAQRSMRTYLGAASQLSPDEVNEESIANSAIVYVEGYLWDEDLAKSSCKKALELAKKNNIQTALSLSDSFCVTKWHEEILDLTKNVDIVFGNEDEFKKHKNHSVLGEVQQPTANLYNSNLKLRDYIDLSGGTKESADQKRIYVVKANGAVALPGRSGWLSRKRLVVEAGDTIIVPIDADKQKTLTVWAEATQIVYQLALGAAAFNNLNN